MADAETIVVPLGRPITTLSGDHKAALEFREPELGDILEGEENAKGSETRMTAFILSRMCGLSLSDFSRVKARDLKVIMRETKPWLDALSDDGEEGNGDQGGGNSPS